MNIKQAAFGMALILAYGALGYFGLSTLALPVSTFAAGLIAVIGGFFCWMTWLNRETRSQKGGNAFLYLGTFGWNIGLGLVAASGGAALWVAGIVYLLSTAYYALVSFR